MLVHDVFIPKSGPNGGGVEGWTWRTGPVQWLWQTWGIAAEHGDPKTLRTTARDETAAQACSIEMAFCADWISTNFGADECAQPLIEALPALREGRYNHAERWKVFRQRHWPPPRQWESVLDQVEADFDWAWWALVQGLTRRAVKECAAARSRTVQADHIRGRRRAEEAQREAIRGDYITGLRGLLALNGIAADSPVVW